MSDNALDRQAELTGIQELLDPEQEWTEEKTRVPYRFTVALLGIIVVSGLFGVVMFSLRENSSDSAPRVMAGTSAATPELNVSTYMETTSAEDIGASVQAAIEGFMTGSTLAERSRFLFDGSADIAKMEAYYYKQGGKLPQGFSQLQSIIPNALDGLPLIMAVALDTMDQQFVFALIPDKDRMLIHWECSVTYCETPLEEFVELKPATPQSMRVFVHYDHLRNLDGLENYVVINDKFNNALFSAYLRPGSKVSEDLFKHLRVVDSKHPVHVNMIWNKEKNMPEITELLHYYFIDFKNLPRF